MKTIKNILKEKFMLCTFLWSKFGHFFAQVGFLSVGGTQFEKYHEMNPKKLSPKDRETCACIGTQKREKGEIEGAESVCWSVYPRSPIPLSFPLTEASEIHRRLGGKLIFFSPPPLRCLPDGPVSDGRHRCEKGNRVREDETAAEGRSVPVPRRGERSHVCKRWGRRRGKESNEERERTDEKAAERSIRTHAFTVKDALPGRKKLSEILFSLTNRKSMFTVTLQAVFLFDSVARKLPLRRGGSESFAENRGRGRKEWAIKFLCTPVCSTSPAPASGERERSG